MDMPLPIQARFTEFEEVRLENGTEVPEGFVNVNGHLVPYWYTRVSLLPTRGGSSGTNMCTGGPHHQVVRLPGPTRLVHLVRGHRLLPRQAEDKKEPGTAGLPQSKSLPLPRTHLADSPTLRRIFLPICVHHLAHHLSRSGSSLAPNSPALTRATPTRSPWATRPTVPSTMACSPTCRPRRPCTTPLAAHPCTTCPRAAPRRLLLSSSPLSPLQAVATRSTVPRPGPRQRASLRHSKK